MLDVRIPYANSSVAEVLGSVPQQYASQDTAVAMARAAYQKAANLAAFGTELLGASLTCALVTDRPKKGEHKVGRKCQTRQSCQHPLIPSMRSPAKRLGQYSVQQGPYN